MSVFRALQTALDRPRGRSLGQPLRRSLRSALLAAAPLVGGSLLASPAVAETSAGLAPSTAVERPAESSFSLFNPAVRFGDVVDGLAGRLRPNRVRPNRVRPRLVQSRQVRRSLDTVVVRGQQPLPTGGLYDPINPYAAQPVGESFVSTEGQVIGAPVEGSVYDGVPMTAQAPTLQAPTLQAPTLPGPPAAAPYDPFSGTVPPATGFDPTGAADGYGVDGYDPMLNGYRADPFNPYVNTPGGGLNAYGVPKTEAFGINGPQPYRYGWREKMDLAINSKVSTDDPDIGGFSISEFNATKGWSGLGPRGWTFTAIPELNYRWLEGPTGPPGLPASLWRFGSEFSFATPIDDGFSIELGITPRIATDFQQSWNSHTWQWDAKAAGYIQLRRDLMLVLGFEYWDRVDDIFIPHAGFIWQASDLVEVRATFPRASIDVFVGTPFGAPTWVYLNGEYRVESYSTEIDPPFLAGQTIRADAVQFSDWRFMLGTRWESGWLVSFIEAGVIVGRDVEFSRRGIGVRDFEVDESFLGRIGFKW